MDAVDQIKQKLDIVDIVGGYVELKKAGRNYRGLCPFHSENTPSFMVSQELQLFKCFGCGESGDMFNFIQKIEGVEFFTALETLAEKADVKIERKQTDPNRSKKAQLYKINQTAAEFYHYLLTKHPSGKVALQYLKEHRKLKPSTISEFKLGFAPDTWDLLFAFLTKKGYSPQDIYDAGLVSRKKSGDGYIDKFRDRVMFPFTGIDGKIIGFNGRTLSDAHPKYLNTPETLIFHKSSFIYGLDKAKVDIKQSGVIFVEGQMDVLTAHQNKFNNVVASSGTALTKSHLNIISRYTQDIIFCFDSDTAGINAIYRGVALAEELDFNVMVAIIPSKYSDLDEYINKKPEDARETLKNPVPVYDFFLVTTVKKHGKNTSIGKKKIAEELVPLFSKIKNPVTFDHYVKTVSEELELSEDTVKDLFKGKKVEALDIKVKSTDMSVFKASSTLSKKSIEEYMLALILKAELDIAQTILYKLGKKDFTNPQLQEIFVTLKDYLLGRKKKFQINYFAGKFDIELKTIVNDLYMWDLDTITENEKTFSQELESTFNRLKKATVKREMLEITEKVKQAEMENDFSTLKEYTEKLKDLSEKLV